MRRGEIWWAALPPPAGRRPVVLLSRDESYAVRDYLVLSPLTTRSRGLRTEVSLGVEDGLAGESVVNLDVIITEAKACLQQRIGVLRPDKLRMVDEALRFALGLDD